jgi:hypothetical protein
MRIPTREDQKRFNYQDKEKLKVIKKYAKQELTAINKYLQAPYYEGRARFLKFVLESKSFAGLPIQSFPKEAIQEIRRLPFMEDTIVPAVYEDKEWARFQYKKIVESKMISQSQGRRGGIKSGVPKKEKAMKKIEAWQQKANAIWAKKPSLSKRNVAMLVAKSLGGKPEYIRQKLIKPTCAS